ILPRHKEFEPAYAAGKPQVLWAELPGDLDTPVSVMLKLGQERRFSALLESVQGGAMRGRYSFLAVEPDLVWRCFGEPAEVCRKIGSGPLAYKLENIPTLQSLRALVAETRIDLPDHLPPMAAGLIGYMGYDTIRLVENIPDKNPDKTQIPDGMFM